MQQLESYVDERAVQRSEFDNMVKEKEITYKRLREENGFSELRTHILSCSSDVKALQVQAPFISSVLVISDVCILCVKIEEEKALMQLRSTLVPQAQPLPKFDRTFRPQRVDEVGDQAQVTKSLGQ